jgi:NAD(P)-dependent dehydrogenase (short-subunit alcohol dehydrogenase family)
MSNLAARRGFRTALVTGASSGLGREFARMLRAEGLEVWGTSRDAARVPTAEGFRALALEVGEAASVRTAVEQFRREAGGAPDVLVNNAGAGVFAALARFPEEEVSGQLRVLLEGPAVLTRAFWPEMLARGRGAVVNVASLAAEFPLPCLSLYSAAKAGLAAFSQALMIEAAGRGVQVVDFQPGDFRTAFNRAARRPEGAEAWEQRAWARFEQLLENGPAPDRAARDLRHALLGGRSGTFATGDFFQTTVAPLAQRLFGRAVVRWFMRKYYRLDG